jgi:hypothetical protein
MGDVCVFGTRACDDEEGTWDALCSQTEVIELPTAVCDSFASCEGSEPFDPIDCVAENSARRLECKTHYLHAPGLDPRTLCPGQVVALPVLSTQCAWVILGGSAQASYQVGLAADPAELPVGASIVDCTAALVLIAATRDPPREDRFLLAHQDAVGDIEVIGVRIEPEPVEECPVVGLECAVFGE